ncbi:hypothetical protein TWF730_001614 [Orbilia blumenaviensis]|uniref:Uncharacterized protein n=1 Tax=Orbilia blumenaviensis TaxID=1796055 RepID=A0AAV9UIZ8_9PEZI
MKSSSLSFVVLWALAGSTYGLNEADRENLVTRDALDLKDDWNENLAVRSLMPDLFENQKRNNPNLRRRDTFDNSPELKHIGERLPYPELGELEYSLNDAPNQPKSRGQGALSSAVSFNVLTSVITDDPILQRMNPSREHFEYLCNWRSPREGFNVVDAYNMLGNWLEKHAGSSSSWCSGPDGFCTKVWCGSGYYIEVCSYGGKPWQMKCSKIIEMARNSLMAKANQDKNIWENGIPRKGPENQDEVRSKQQAINDRKMICIDHSAVYQPEALTLTFFNTNPRLLVRTSYGYSDKRVKCDPPGIQADVGRVAASQEQFMKIWYERYTIKDIEGDEEKDPKDSPGAKPNAILNANSTLSVNSTARPDPQKPQADGLVHAQGRTFLPKGSTNDTDTYGLPYYYDPHGTYPDPPSKADPFGFVSNLSKDKKVVTPGNNTSLNSNSTLKNLPVGGIKGSTNVNLGKDGLKPSKDGKEDGGKEKPVKLWTPNRKSTTTKNIWGTELPEAYIFKNVHYKTEGTRKTTVAKGPPAPNRQAPTGVIPQQVNTASTPSGAQKAEKTGDIDAAAPTTRASAAHSGDHSAANAAPVTTAPSNPEGTNSATKGQIKSDAPAPTQIAASTLNNNESSTKDEPTSVEEEPVTPNSETAAPRAKTTAPKDEVKPADTPTASLNAHVSQASA